jgi:cytoskeletal protein CcmA (bactofilin family)
MLFRKEKRKGMEEMNYADEGGFAGNSKARTLMTIQGDSAKLEGNFTISESIEIDCEVKGSMTVDGQLIIKKDGFVGADVKTKDAEIIGRYEGSMEASGKVEIKDTGVVNGSITTDSLIINEGGIFSGDVKRMNNKTREDISPKHEDEPEEDMPLMEDDDDGSEEDEDGLNLE